jgi:hypothetical protein
MQNFTPHIYSFILPLFIGTVLLIVKGNYLRSLAQPLSIAIFGAGKTYRAFIFMPVICGLSSLLLRSALLHAADHLWSFFLGYLLGFIYLLAELPNSYVKRRLKISAGQSHPAYKKLQYVVDKTDSLVPLCIVYYYISGVSFAVATAIFTVSLLIHVFFSWLLFRFKIKQNF